MITYSPTKGYVVLNAPGELNGEYSDATVSVAHTDSSVWVGDKVIFPTFKIRQFNVIDRGREITIWLLAESDILMRGVQIPQSGETQ